MARKSVSPINPTSESSQLPYPTELDSPIDDSPIDDSSSAYAIPVLVMSELDNGDREDDIKPWEFDMSDVPEERSIPGRRFYGDYNMEERLPSTMEWLWGCMNVISFVSMLVFFNFFLARWISEIYEISHATLLQCSLPLIFCETLYVFWLLESCLGMPTRFVGRVGRVICDGIALVAAFILREALPYDGSESSIYALFLLLFLSVNLHSWLQVLHRADDISVCDVLLEVIMQALVYVSTGHDIACLFIVLFFVGAICYKYISYSVPITLEDRKKDLESLPD